MPAQISESLIFEISLGDSIALQDLESHKDALQKRGVYFLHEGPTGIQFDPYSSQVVYVGKAIQEKIYSRCYKHRAALRGDPNMRPGKNFKAYAQANPRAIDKLYVVPGFMDPKLPFLISCAEEYLLYQYAQRQGKPPRANTKQ